jgi:hypothetical protein
MSGFERRPSPAQKAATERARAARRLTNLKIHEVSSVDRGAAHGATVQLLKGKPKMPTTLEVQLVDKRQSEDIFAKAIGTAMPGVAISAVCKKLVADHARGAITPAAFAKFQQELAVSLHPTASNVGVAMQRFFDSAIGKAMLADASSSGYERLQKSTALGNGYEVAKLNEMDRAEPCEDVEDCDKALEVLGKAVMAKLGGKMTLAQAITFAIENTQIGKDLARKSMDKNLQRQYPISP